MLSHRSSDSERSIFLAHESDKRPLKPSEMAQVIRETTVNNAIHDRTSILEFENLRYRISHQISLKQKPSAVLYVVYRSNIWYLFDKRTMTITKII